LENSFAGVHNALQTMRQREARLRVLVIEDDPDDARVIFQALRATGRFEPFHVRTGSEGIEELGGRTFDVFLVDYRLPDMSGVEVCRLLRSLSIRVPILMLSSVQSDEVVGRAKIAGATDFVIKHLSFGDHLIAELDRVLVEA
jgi:PleD family two-component response regulator